MKRLLISLLSIVLLISIPSCVVSQRPLKTEKINDNNTYTMSYLFEYNGCKFYRFYDNGNYVYFTDCRGKITSISNDSIKTRTENMIITDEDINN